MKTYYQMQNAESRPYNNPTDTARDLSDNLNKLSSTEINKHNNEEMRRILGSIDESVKILEQVLDNAPWRFIDVPQVQGLIVSAKQKIQSLSNESMKNGLLLGENGIDGEQVMGAFKEIKGMLKNRPKISGDTIATILNYKGNTILPDHTSSTIG